MSKESKSLGWVREGALWEYQKPPTARDRALENARKYQELRDKWREKIGPNCCPECGSDLIEEWCIGWWPSEEHYHDPNRKTCDDCGYQWFQSCPTCGQQGGRRL